MTIRPATVMDLPWLRQMFANFVTEFHSPYPVTDVEELDRFVLAVSQALRATDQSFFLAVADDNQGHPIAFIGGGVNGRPVGKPAIVGTVYWLYVVPSARGQGIGRQLAAAGLAWLRATWPQIQSLEIPSRAGDTQWQARGFTPFLVYHHGPLSLCDQFVTKKDIPAGANGQGVLAPHVLDYVEDPTATEGADDE